MNLFGEFTTNSCIKILNRNIEILKIENYKNQPSLRGKDRRLPFLVKIAAFFWLGRFEDFYTLSLAYGL